MVGCGVSWLMVVMVVVVAVVKGQERVEVDCSDINELRACSEDQGPIDPIDGQSVYLGGRDGPGTWWYPSCVWFTRHCILDSHRHDIRTITDTKDSWARWIWHDCGDQYVCLESARYPNYYYYSSSSNKLRVAYSTAPKTDYWTRQKVNAKWTTSRGLYFHLVDERWYNEGIRLGLSTYVHIPPRCEGYKMVANQINNSPLEYQYKYTYEQGIVNTKSKGKIDVSLPAEISIGIVSGSLSGSFSISWMNEHTAASERQSHESTVMIPPMKRVVIWQKVATYGHYAWNSGVNMMCMTDI